jgi:hypothetical protein
MTSLRTDFEKRAIWQGYIEDPTAKDFVARKAHTIALSKAQGIWQSTLFTSLEIPWGFHTRAVLHSLAGLMSREKVSVRGFLWVRKGWFAFAQWTFASETFGKRRKTSCFQKPMHSVPEIWGRMYDVPARSAKDMRTGQEIRFPCSRERREEISK